MQSDVEDDSEREGGGGGILLGFSEEPEAPRFLLRHFFPSKIGGQPAWLDPIRLPTNEDNQTKCCGCGGPLSFLLQLYCPINLKDECFHRTLYVFTCTKEECLRKNLGVTVLRCQLRRKNPYYGYHPCEDDQEQPVLAPGQKCEPPQTGFLGPWAESELVTDEEPRDDAGEAQEGESNESELDRLARQYGGMVVGRGGGEGEDMALGEEGQDDEGDIDLNEMDENGDEEWAKFRKRLSRAPSQCVRYCGDPEGGEPEDGEDRVPLWPSSSNLPGEIPKCELCGEPRKFEFQVLPQVLYYAGVDSGLPDDLDFTTIAVYTCTCDVWGGQGSAYAREFAWTHCNG
ncbi:programmed cell death protein 2 [Chloropicon roscoffensis]|uniref:Programmed cell death protein 2 n=2 Tax=Chloropicon roscoffensis TaxID=1461544 RepID=A0AAX4P4Q2_9CHLO